MCLSVCGGGVLRDLSRRPGVVAALREAGAAYSLNNRTREAFIHFGSCSHNGDLKSQGDRTYVLCAFIMSL